ncbi:LANO_0H06018g1_1 [Lachancea nothofagi CBS 11611]|uniref:ferroxidase n=1 Tax=Lachancea nothofagi CBS 11611 TaxID=1266666 RepID=A0A1G4KLB8_9SACH|nr:LANO_0H06018g1_1 [Lachancea nothofagi CBS 11611]
MFLVRRSIFLGARKCARVPLLKSSGCVSLRRPTARFNSIRTLASNGGPGSTDGHQIPREVLELSSDVYHTRSDAFLEAIQDQLEEISDLYPQLLPDVELNQGVMTVAVPAFGTYVLNKQPPNKQIWLSSPISGPNRFDLVQERWVSLRDGQELLELLNRELSTAIPEPVALDA